MPSAPKPAGAEDAERALSRDQPSAAAAAVPTPANNGSASADGAEVISKEHQQNPLGNDDLLQRLLLAFLVDGAEVITRTLCSLREAKAPKLRTRDVVENNVHRSQGRRITPVKW